MALSAMKAIKGYIEQGSEERVGAKELLAFKHACSEEEYERYGREAAELLGDTLEVK